MTFNNLQNILMCNRLAFSNCDAPAHPTTSTQHEALLVSIHGDLMSVADLVTPENKQACDDAQASWAVQSRLYARRTLTLDKAMMSSQHTVDTDLSMILPAMPQDGGVEAAFFPAIGTIAFWQDENGKYQLRAAGIDTNNGGRCRGWIFNASSLN